MFFDTSYILWVFIPTLVLSLFAQWRVKSAFAKWSKVRNQKGISGGETAELIKQRAQLGFVKTQWVPGQMTDHYDPRDKSINLSESSRDPSVAAMAIVAHELGHAEQDRVGYTPMRIRSSLVPAANLGTKLGLWLVIGGLMLNAMLGPMGDVIAWVGVFMFGAAIPAAERWAEADAPWRRALAARMWLHAPWTLTSGVALALEASAP